MLAKLGNPSATAFRSTADVVNFVRSQLMAERADAPVTLEDERPDLPPGTG